MKFEKITCPSKRIAVVGGGISGMGAAHTLGSNNRVTVFETEPRLGGHARTVIAGKNGNQPVDTGFLVFNYANYPLMGDLFARLNVPVVKSNMSFGASIDGGRLEYGLASLDALFAQRSNAFNPKFLGMVRDIFKFNKKALAVAETDPSQTVSQLLDALGTGDWFRQYYLLPLSGAIWSTPINKIMNFPAHAMIQFFENHALLKTTGQHQWYTVDGGSIEYVHRLETALTNNGVELRSNTPVQSVRRTPLGVEVKAWGDQWRHFDEVIFATHSDDSLRLLADPTPAERFALGTIKYQPNQVTLHCDGTIMPRKRQTWSSWVYTEDKDSKSDCIDLTYWINSLQRVPMDDPHFVTLNTKRNIREELIYDETVLRHPVFDLAALAAQEAVRAMNGANHTWFCGAWMRHGFHEDGLSSGVDVARSLMTTSSAQIAAE
ncbi:MAG: NAD(P)-binding protein [Tateyamaria sp.]|jgi:predicted NAD/FAD-binding protein|nr:NAD(P)-binding protein [Tateyamaria sp.]MBT5302491.1 NAD(P)-binding protein [Tateyamaria sp.]MBT6266199.1 NAD(P)-binding protein [Tateyamaria sp.]MBT7447353.1 NAD(P)-binding protein [Tateyamaria sp.]MBT7800564.1 NAD(P)-binding protein [Tateyamaria sp.]